MGIDGTTYMFMTSKTNKCAMAWSPENDTRALEIVDLYYSAVNYTSRSKDHPISHAELLSQIESLQNK